MWAQGRMVARVTAGGPWWPPGPGGPPPSWVSSGAYSTLNPQLSTLCNGSCSCFVDIIFIYIFHEFIPSTIVGARAVEGPDSTVSTPSTHPPFVHKLPSKPFLTLKLFFVDTIFKWENKNPIHQGVLPAQLGGREYGGAWRGHILRGLSYQPAPAGHPKLCC